MFTHYDYSYTVTHMGSPVWLRYTSGPDLGGLTRDPDHPYGCDEVDDLRRIHQLALNAGHTIRSGYEWALRSWRHGRMLENGERDDDLSRVIAFDLPTLVPAPAEQVEGSALVREVEQPPGRSMSAFGLGLLLAIAIESIIRF